VELTAFYLNQYKFLKKNPYHGMNLVPDVYDISLCCIQREIRNIDFLISQFILTFMVQHLTSNRCGKPHGFTSRFSEMNRFAYCLIAWQNISIFGFLNYWLVTFTHLKPNTFPVAKDEVNVITLL